MPWPLQEFTVIETCQMVAGPWAGTLLADLGADVIDIERPPAKYPPPKVTLC